MRPFGSILCGVGAVLLVLAFPIDANTTLNVPSLECYINKTDCIKTCGTDCYFVNNCNGELNRFVCLPFSPTLIIILIVAVCLIISLCCCCCVGVVICLVVKRARRRRNEGQVVFDGKTTVVETAPS